MVNIVHVDRDIPDMDAVVVLLDALSVKGIWKSKDPKEVLSKWRDLKIAFESRCEFLSLELNKRQIDDRVSFTAFSDTIIITLPIQKRNVGKDLGRNEASLVFDSSILVGANIFPISNNLRYSFLVGWVFSELMKLKYGCPSSLTSSNDDIQIDRQA